jgi:hypothetical protein
LGAGYGARTSGIGVANESMFQTALELLDYFAALPRFCGNFKRSSQSMPLQ